MKTIQALTAASNHSLRHDASSNIRLRLGARKGAGLAWTILPKRPDGKWSFDTARDVISAFRAQKARHLVKSDNGDLGAHIILSVSAAWAQETGDLHDPKNPRNAELFRQAIHWAETAFGKGSVYQARMDLDEVGGGVVDLFVAPVRIDGRSKKPRISMNKALKEIQERHGRRRSYEALQDSWASWCALHLSPVIERGRPKSETRAENLNVEEYKEARKQAQAKIEREHLLASAKAQIILDRAKLLETEAETERRRLVALREALIRSLEKVKAIFQALLRTSTLRQERDLLTEQQSALDTVETRFDI